jgi:hypothetical protein
VDARRRLVGTVPVVPLGGARVAIHAQEDVHQEVKVSVVEQLHLARSDRANSLCGRLLGQTLYQTRVHITILVLDT